MVTDRDNTGSLNSILRANGESGVPTPAGGQFEYRYGFKVGPLLLLHDGTTAVEVINPGKVTPLPNVPDWLSGLTNIRGNLIPVFDLGGYLSLNRSSVVPFNAGAQRYLVFGGGQRSAIIIIDDLPVQLRIMPGSGEHKSAGTPDLLKPFDMGLYQIDGQYWTQIQFDQLFLVMGTSISGTLASGTLAQPALDKA